MSFSEQAIGFYLQMRDEMTPQFPAALSAYKKFVGSMEKLNKSAFASTSGLFAQLSQLVRGAGKLATGTALKVNLSLTPKSKKAFASLIGDAVSNALSGAKIRLRASMPKTVSKLFSADASLRTLYSDMPQPPDMVGKIQKFAEGGKVKGGTPGKDSVLSLLTPGEVVIPTDLVDKLEKALDQVSGRKDVLEAGFGNKEDIKFYQKGIAEIAMAMEALANATKQTAIEEKTRLTPQITSLQEKFRGLTKVEKEASDEAENFMSRVLGPARFIALQTSLRGLQEGFSQFTGSLQQASGELGGGEFQSFPDRLREIRQRLGLGADEAARFTGAIAQNSKELGTNYFKALEATDALITAGVKDQKKLIEQSALLARANRVTGAEFADLSNVMFRYTGELNGSSAGFDALILSIDRMTKSADLAVNTPELMDALAMAMDNPSFKDAGPEAIQNMANNLLALRAASQSVWAGDSGIEEIFKKSTSDSTALAQVIHLTGGYIRSFEDARQALSSRGGLNDAFDAMAANLERMDSVQINAIAESINIDPGLLKRTKAFADAQRKASGLAVPLDESATAGNALSASMDKMTTAAESLNNTIANFVGSSGPMQTLVEFLDQVPVLALLAGAHLGGSLLRSVMSLGKGVFGVLGGIFGKFGGPVAKLLGKAGAVGGVAESFGGAGAGGVTSGVTAKGLLVAGTKVALIVGAVSTVLLLIGGYADDLLPVLEQTLPGLMKIGKFVAEEVGIGLADTISSLINIFTPLANRGPEIEKATDGLMSSAKFLGGLALAGVEIGVVATGAVLGDAIGSIMSAFGLRSPLESLREQSASIVDTLLAVTFDFLRLGPVTDRVTAIRPGLYSSIEFMGLFVPLGLQMAVAGTGATIGDAVSKFVGLFGVKSPMEALRNQSEQMVDTLLAVTFDLQRLAPVNDRIPKLQPGIEGSAKFMTMLAPMLDQAKSLGDAAGRLGDGWFTSGPLSNLRTQAEPMVDTITELSVWFTRVPQNAKALAGVDYARVFFSKLALTVGAMQQVGSVDAAAVQRAASAITSVSLSQPNLAPSVSKDQIDQIMQVVVQAGEQSPLHRDLQETNDLLRQLISAVTAQSTTDRAAAIPAKATAPTTRMLDSMSRDLSRFRE